LHHNVDKAVLVGGSSEADFGGGRVIAPIQIYIVGRATSSPLAFTCVGNKSKTRRREREANFITLTTK
jgi:S-adenosylmethionine synthetase